MFDPRQEVIVTVTKWIVRVGAMMAWTKRPRAEWTSKNAVDTPHHDETCSITALLDRAVIGVSSVQIQFSAENWPSRCPGAQGGVAIASP